MLNVVISTLTLLFQIIIEGVEWLHLIIKTLSVLILITVFTASFVEPHMRMAKIKIQCDKDIAELVTFIAGGTNLALNFAIAQSATQKYFVAETLCRVGEHQYPCIYLQSSMSLLLHLILILMYVYLAEYILNPDKGLYVRCILFKR